MFDTSTGAADAIARLADAVDGLMALNLPLAADDSVLDVLRSLQTQVNRLGAVDAALVGEVDSRRLWFDRGCPTTAALLTQLLRIEPGEARARVATAADLAPRHTLTGDVLDPVFPTAAGAVADGSISTKHAAVISRTVTDLPTAVAAEHDRAVDIPGRTSPAVHRGHAAAGGPANQ
jgi:hypothetical protein